MMKIQLLPVTKSCSPDLLQVLRVNSNRLVFVMHRCLFELSLSIMLTLIRKI